MLRYIIGLLIMMSFSIVPLFTQIAGERMDINVKKMNGSDYLQPFIGGMNNPQFSAADFNNDGVLDLLVFDRAGYISLTFINQGTPNEIDYVFAPQYAKNFPEKLNSWVLMADYNNDGAYDLFTYSNAPGIPGIELYRGFFNGDDELSFEKYDNPRLSSGLLSYPLSNGLDVGIYAAYVDIPSFLDVDFDGDLDVMNFSQAGNKIIYYQNQSQEMGYGADSLIFLAADECWGEFLESGTSSDILLSNNPAECADENLSLSGGAHAGSTLACWDSDDDGDIEILVGDITINTLGYLKSSATGNDDSPWFDELDAAFPSYNTPVDIPIFPAPFVLDLNNDGRKDLVAGPNDEGASVNKEVAWYYENTSDSGEAAFNFIRKDFLVGDGVDLGQGSKPAFFDYNADGLLDIVIGTDGYYNGGVNFDTRLVLFENTGTSTVPEFTMVDEDWLGFSQYTDRNLAPAFGDLDGDGDMDLLIGQTDGDIFYAENTGSDGPAVFNTIIPEYQSIFGGVKCVPAMGDLDGDGLMDIITGYKQGRMAFFKNIGTPGNPAFEGDKTIAPNVDGLGNVDVRVMYFGSAIDQRGYAAPKFFMENGTEPRIICPNYFGDIFIFSNVQDSLNGTFTEDTNRYADIREGHQVAIDIADIDEDGYFEIVVGNFRGGLSMFNTDIISDEDLIIDVDDVVEIPSDFKIVPNPAHDRIQIFSQMDLSGGEIGLLDLNGRWVRSMKKGKSIDLVDLPSGVYIVSFSLGEYRIMERIVKL